MLTHFLLWSVRLHLTLVYMTIWYQQISKLHQSMKELGYQQIFLSKTEIDLTIFKGSIIALWCNWMRLHFYWKCHVADWIFTVYYLNHVAMFFLHYQDSSELLISKQQHGRVLSLMHRLWHSQNSPAEVFIMYSRHKAGQTKGKSHILMQLPIWVCGRFYSVSSIKEYDSFWSHSHPRTVSSEAAFQYKESLAKQKFHWLRTVYFDSAPCIGILPNNVVSHWFTLVCCVC